MHTSAFSYQSILNIFEAVPAVRFNPRPKAWDFLCHQG